MPNSANIQVNKLSVDIFSALLTLLHYDTDADYNSMTRKDIIKIRNAEVKT
jgi:hypothetical protein